MYRVTLDSFEDVMVAMIPPNVDTAHATEVWGFLEQPYLKTDPNGTDYLEFVSHHAFTNLIAMELLALKDM